MGERGVEGEVVVVVAAGRLMGSRWRSVVRRSMPVSVSCPVYNKANEVG